jgi:RNA polymerase sigma-70 factor, ECF subfamily
VTDRAVKQEKGPVGQTSLGLLQRARAGESAAWNRLVALYTPLAGHWCRAYGLQPADVEDVLQEVFLAVARKLPDFRAGPEGGVSFRAWLRVIAANKVRDHWRGKEPGAGGSDAQQRLEQVPDVFPADSDDGTDEAEKRMLYQRALELIATEFSETTWQAFWRFFVTGRSAADVAEELGITVNAVYLAKGRVIGRVRAEFGGLLEG